MSERTTTAAAEKFSALDKQTAHRYDLYMPVRVFVCRKTIDANRRTGADDPVIVVDRDGREELCRSAEVVVAGAVVGRFVCDVKASGAKAWFEAVDCEVRPAGA